MAKWKTSKDRVSKEDKILRIISWLLYLTCSMFKIDYANIFITFDDEATITNLRGKRKEEVVADSYKIIKNKEKK